MELENFIIRRGVFETNSSSTHTLVILEEDDLGKWYSDKYCYDIYNRKIISLEERTERVVRMLLEDMHISESYFKPVINQSDIDAYINNNYYELPLTGSEFDTYMTYNKDVRYAEYITKDNTIINILSLYGYDY